MKTNKLFILFFLFISLASFSLAQLPTPTIITNSELVITKYDNIEAETYLPEIEGNQLCLYHKAGTNATSINELKQLISEAQDQTPNWSVGISYSVGDLVKYNDLIYKVLQAHTSQSDWTPNVVPALFVEYAFQSLGEVPQWTQPTGAHDAYNIEDRVWFEVNEDKLIYESLINANVWSPTAYPAGWKEIGIITETEIYGDENITAINELGSSIVVPRDLEEGVSTYCVNVTQKIQIGTNTIIAEWINSTLYIYKTDKLDLDQFEIEILCNNVKVEAPDIEWTSNEPIKEGIKFSANISNFTCSGNLTFRQNKLETIKCSNSFFLTDCEKGYIDYTDFITSNVNQFEKITEMDSTYIKQTVTNIYPEGWDGWYYCVGLNPLHPTMWYDCMDIPIAYDTTYYGNFTDLDPSLQVVFSSTSDLIGNGSDSWRNQTEVSTHGVRIMMNVSNYTDTGLPAEGRAYNYSTGSFRSFVFYNSTSTYWNVTQSIADSNGSAEVYDLCANDANCVSYWDLDDNTNGILDNKGSNDGVATGTNNATGISSGAVRFDGVDDYVDIDGVVTNGFGNESGTFSMWINTDEIKANQYLIDIENPRTVILTVGTDELNFHVDGDAFITTDLNMLADTWYHIVSTWDLSVPNRTLYVNGVLKLDDGGSWTPGVASGAGTIGSRYSEDQGYFNGSIDEVLIYNDSLTPSEVTELYKAGLSQHANANVTLETRTADSYNISDAGLVSLWSFNDDNSTTAFDETGRNNGTRLNVADATEGNGTVGKGQYFNGTETHTPNIGIVIDNEQNFDFISTSQFVVSMWVKPKGLRTMGLITKRDSGSTATTFQYYVNTANGEIKLYNGVNVYSASPAVYISDLTWTHLSFIHQGDGTIDIYKNGILVSAFSQGIVRAENDDEVVIGSDGIYQGNVFSGAIDEVRIYNRSLSADEIQNLYELGSYHIEWGDWADEGKVTDGIPTTSTSKGKFMQYKATLNTNDTDVSAYILNVSINMTDAPSGDTTPPNVTILSPLSQNYTTASIDFNVTATDDIAVDTCIGTIDDWSSSFTLNFTNSSVPNGEYIFNVSCNDSSGNINDTEFVSFNVSVLIEYPYPSIIYIPPTPLNNSFISLGFDTFWHNISFLNGANITSVSFCLDNLTSPCATCGCGNHAYNETEYQRAINTDGNYSINVTACNVWGNCNSTEERYFVMDDTPPVFTGINNITITEDDSLDIDFNATDLYFEEFSINWTDNFSITIDGNLTNTTNLSVDVYYINVTINDSAGNTNSQVIWVNVTDIACVETLTNTTPVTFNVTACQTNDTINQQVNWTQYDSSFCGVTVNETFTNYTYISCNYCSYDLQVTDYTEYLNVTSCQANDTKNQDSTATQYDANYATCCAITGIAGDCTYETNVTLHNYSSTPCLYPCTMTIDYPMNVNYVTNITRLDYSVYDYSGIDSCWWYNGTTNSSPDTTCANFTGMQIDTSATWVMYANDTLGSMCSDSVTFTIGAVATTVSAIKCRYSFFGYYNLRIPFMVEDNCLR